MSYVTIEDRVDRLEAMFGQFMTQMALLNKRADERHKEAEGRMARFERDMRESREASRREMTEFKNEMRLSRETSEREMTEFKNEMRLSRETSEREMAEFKNEMRQSKKDLDKKWGDLANKMGTIVEDILCPNLRRLATEYFGLPEILDIYMRWNRKKPNTLSSWQEFDLVITGPDSVIVGEAKSSMNLEAADKYAEKLKGFAEFAPHLAHLRMIPVLGCWSMPPQVVNHLTELGIYAMCMGEDTMEIVNGDALMSRSPH